MMTPQEIFRQAIRNVIAPQVSDLLDVSISIVDKKFKPASSSERATVIAATLVALAIGYQTFEGQ